LTPGLTFLFLIIELTVYRILSSTGDLNAHIKWNDFASGTNFTIGIRKAF